MVSSILPKNELENSNFCPSLMGQKFFVRFMEELKTQKSPCEINWPLKKIDFSNLHSLPLFQKFCILWNTPEQVARDRKKCFWYHIFWSGKLLYAWQSQNIGLCILKDPYHFGKKGSLRSCSELPELSVIFSRPIMWLVRVFFTDH